MHRIHPLYQIPNDFKSEARRPASWEAERIAEIVREYNHRTSKNCRWASVVSAAIGTALIATLVGGITKESLFAAFLGCICFLIFFSFWKSKRDCEERADIYASGNFEIVDGKISSVETNPDTPGCCNIRFTSYGGTAIGEWFRVKQEEASIGTSAILVLASDRKGKSSVAFVLPKSMLKEE